VLVATVLSRWRRGLVERRALARRVFCRWCQHVFEEEGGGIVVCPRCGAENRKGTREGGL
jgi:Zn finger protein HypA/HybF involved in hydrogenase expression